jgi:peptide deformylase
MIDIIQTGHPLLRTKARALTLEEIKGDNIQELIALMRDTMRQAPGVGLAATQIGHSIQLIVIEDRKEYHERLTNKELKDRERHPIEFTVLINPQLTITSNDTVIFFEGCLSIKGFQAMVPRAYSVHVQALNEQGIPVEINASGWYARILQHEIDHLSGTLYVDHMQTITFSTTENFEKFWRERGS